MSYLEKPRLWRANLLPRSRSLDMAVMGDSGKKKRGGKVFGSLERGLDKMINMLTPNKRRALRDGPRKIKVERIAWYLLSSAHVLSKSGFFCLCFCFCSHSTTLLWPVRPTQTRFWTRSSPSCQRKTSISHRKGKPLHLASDDPSLNPVLVISFVLHSRYTLKCRTKGDFGKVTMEFELEVCLLQRPEVVGVRRQRLKGDAWVYKHLVEDILSTLSI